MWHKDRTGPLASLYGITDKDKDTSKEPEGQCEHHCSVNFIGQYMTNLPTVILQTMCNDWTA